MADVFYLWPGGGDQDLHMFRCPGCKRDHPVRTRGDEAKHGPVWGWNGDLVKPTITPSLLVDPHYPPRRCHSFIRDGMIQFLDDCHHDLKGQTVPLAPYPHDR